MPTSLSKPALESSTYTITVAFFDDAGSPMTPISVTWTLQDAEGAIINDREDEVVSPLGVTVDIELSGNDLAVGANGTRRILTTNIVDASSKPLVDQCHFNVTDLYHAS